MTKLGQHLIILGKLWIKKHKMILNISCNKFMFWPDHYQHANALENAPKVEKMQYIPNFTIEDVPNKKNELNPISAITITTNSDFSKP